MMVVIIIRKTLYNTMVIRLLNVRMHTMNARRLRLQEKVQT